MERRIFTALIIMMFTGAVNAQTVKTGVVVIGNGNSSIGAGIQSAVSGVKTILLLPGEGFELSSMVNNQHSGIEAEFLNKLRISKGIKDSTAVVNFDNIGANVVLKAWTDSIKNLTVIRNGKWSKLKRSGSGWSIELNDGRTIKAEVLLNADKSGLINTALGIQPADRQWLPFTDENNVYKTSIASGYFEQGINANVLSLYRLLIPEQENLVMLNANVQSLAAGQAAGATAAYAAFYKLKTSNADLKAIQGELIKYKLSVIPFSDISPADSNWKAIQFLGLSGFLKPDFSNGMAFFDPDKQVSSEEITAPVKGYYYKSQIWFDDHKAPLLTIDATLDMIAYVNGLSLSATTTEVKKNWKSSYHFKTDFDGARTITRREFAVLVNQYMKPFNVNIDKTGRVIR